MITDADGTHPESLWIEADQRFYKGSLAKADLVVHGRNSKEFISGRHPEEYKETVERRRRIIVTRQIKTLAFDHSNHRALFWNPAGAPFERACEMLGVCDGIVVINGGTDVYNLFLEIGYDAFYLSRVGRVRLPGGRPLFSGVPRRSPKNILEHYGLHPSRQLILDSSFELTMTEWLGSGIRSPSLLRSRVQSANIFVDR